MHRSLSRDAGEADKYHVELEFPDLESYSVGLGTQLWRLAMFGDDHRGSARKSPNLPETLARMSNMARSVNTTSLGLVLPLINSSFNRDLIHTSCGANPMT